MITIFAMLLSTAAARTLKGVSCDEDYQSPNYWGKCIDGEYRNMDKNSAGGEMGCDTLVILVPKDIVGNKTLSILSEVHEGIIIRDLFLNDYGYYAVAIFQDLKGPDISIEFYLDGIPVHVGNYQQNFCFWEAGSITTNDHDTDTYEGSRGLDMPGHVIIKSLSL